MLFYYRNFAYCFYLGSSYAYEHILTDTDIRTICDNNFGTGTTYANLFYDKIKALKDEFYSYNYDLIIINMHSSSWNQVDVYGTVSSRISSVDLLNNVNYMDITMSGNGIHARILKNGWNAVRVDRYSMSSGNTYPVGSGAQQRSNYLLYTNDLGSIATGPYQNLNWLTFVPPQVFEILMNIDSSTQYISIIDSNDIEIDNIAVLDSSFIGTLNDDFDYPILSDNLTIWYFNSGEWYEKRLYNRADRSDDILYNNSYLSFISQDLVDSELTNITIKDLYKYYNVVYVFNVVNQNFDSAQARFMFKNSNTVINNGSVDTSNFGSDYSNQFDNLDNMINNNNNTQEIIDNVNDDSQVDNILDSISSGDDIESLANNLGIVTIENPFTDIVFGIFNGAIDSLTSSGDVSLNFGFHGQNIYISSSDFSTPSNIITEFIGLILDALFIYALYWYYFMIIESIKNFTFYQDIVNDKKWVVSSSESGGLNWRLL